MIMILLIAGYTFVYPILMSYLWIVGSVLFTIKNHKPYKRIKKMKKEEQFFTIVVPIFNEEENIINTLKGNLMLNYSNYEILLIDDCSTDNTVKKIEDFLSDNDYKNVRLIKRYENTGKASVLNYALEIIKSKWFLCIDSDALLQKDALFLLNNKIDNDSKVIAYTGTPKLRDVKTDKKDKSYKIKLIQQLEYRQIIGMIKRSQMFFAKKITTLSGVCVCYKTEKIKEIGGFDTENATEDIEITWRIYEHGYLVEYFALFVIYMYTPGDLASIISQRSRWALGGIQTSFKYYKSVFKLKPFRAPEKAFMLELLMSSIWVVSFFLTSFYVMIRLVFFFPKPLTPTEFSIPTVLLLITNILLTTLAYYIEYGKRETIFPFITHIWYYPLVYWLITPLGFINGYIEFLKRKISKTHSGVWRSKNKINFKEQLIKSIVVDVFCFSLMLFLIRIFATKYVRSNQQLESVFIPVLVVIIFYTYLSYRYWYKKNTTLGNRLFGIKVENNIYMNFFRFANILTTASYYYYTYQLYYISTKKEEVEFITNKLMKMHFPNYAVMVIVMFMVFNIIFFKYIVKNTKEYL